LLGPYIRPQIASGFEPLLPLTSAAASPPVANSKIRLRASHLRRRQGARLDKSAKNMTKPELQASLASLSDTPLLGHAGCLCCPFRANYRR
jgi:hypothetical protein